MLFGNAAVKSRLGRAVEDSTLPHAFLIASPKGSGKRTLALEIAMALNCESKHNGATPLPCRRCNTCRRIAEGNFTDIVRLKRSGERATIGVEEVRLFRDDMFLSPTESSFKIYIVEEAEKLTPNAQNALLTVLEEPPSSVIIFLLAESLDKILTTIKSRAQIITMERFFPDALKQYLIQKSDVARLYSHTSPDTLDGIIMSSDGTVGRALSLLSEKDAKNISETRALTEKIVSTFRSGAPYSELHTAMSELPTAREDFICAVETLICAVRDLALIKYDGNVNLSFYSSRDEALETVGTISSKRLLMIYDVLKGALEDATKNVSTFAILSVMRTKIRLL